MSTFVVSHDPATGQIQDYRYEHGAYVPREGELALDDATHGPRDLIGRYVDTSADPPALARDPDWRPIAELRATVARASLTPVEQAVYELFLRVHGDELLAQEHDERAYGPGPDLANGWREDPTRGTERDQ